ncbi:MAG: carboxypeptidase regulatory-like domain-containing protein [Deltaproteobacteria bacterium]|nr:carboxypeptidase regulatory-like domain-containing protein [Deltaproteobacteria bacterium]
MSRRGFKNAAFLIAVTAVIVVAWGVRLRDRGRPESPRGAESALLADAATPDARALLGDAQAASQVTLTLGTSQILGRVVDLAGNGVASVQVALFKQVPVTQQDLAQQRLAAVTTDRSGAFSMNGLSRGLYVVRVEGPGILGAEVRRVVVPGEDVRIVVSQRVDVTGRVTDNGRPAGGATVEIGGSVLDAPRTALAGPDGRFSVGELPEGTYVISARRGMRAAVAQSVSRFGRGPWEEVTINLQPAALVEGKVTDATTGEPVSSARVLLTSDEAEVGASRRAVTGPDGAFSLEGVSPGSWSFDVDADGYLPPVAQALEIREGMHLRLAPKLSRGGEIEGRVTDVRGVPVRGARVELVLRGKKGERVLSSGTRARRRAWTSGAAQAQASAGRVLPIGELGVMPGPIPYPPPPGVLFAERTGGDRAIAFLEQPGFVTDEAGKFRVDAVPPGEVVVRASHPELAQGESAPVAVAAGVVREVLVVLGRGAAITGRVTDERGEPVLGADVQARSRGVLAGVTLAGEQGQYRLERFTGEVLLRASAPGRRSVERRVIVGKEHEGAEIRQDFVLATATLIVEGRVEDPMRRPVSGAQVVIAGDQGPRASTTTGEDGRFSLRGLASGTYRIEVKHDSFPPATVPRVTSGSSDVDVVLAFGGGIAGEVRDAQSRRPISSFSVAGEGPTGSRFSRSFSGGEYTVVPLIAGPWTLTFSASGYASRVLSLEVPEGREPRVVTVQGVRVELSLGGTIAGTVYTTHGEPLSGATVEGGGAKGTTDSRGLFRLKGVAPGDVTLSARHPEHGLGTSVVPLRSGDEVLTVEIRLSPP